MKLTVVIMIDNYYWLNDRNNPEVIDYLERENDYYEKLTSSSKSVIPVFFALITSSSLLNKSLPSILPPIH